MPRVLRNLRIDEVSAVSRGAGEGVRIMLMKRDDAQPPRTVGKRFSECMAEADAVADVAKATAHRNRHGHHQFVGALFEHLHDRLAGLRRKHGFEKSAKETQMDIHKALVSLVQEHGLHAVAKSVVEQGRAPCTEAEFTAVVTEYAKGEHPELSAAAAFTRLYESDALVRQAFQVAKANSFAEVAMDMTPTVISGGEWRDDADAAEAMAQLAEIGRKMAPAATAAKQFALAFEDPKNSALAQRAHRRPTAPAGSAYQYPR